MFYTKILFSGMFDNVYCATNMKSDGILNLKFSTDVQDSYKLRILKSERSKTHRFLKLGG